MNLKIIGVLQNIERALLGFIDNLSIKTKLMFCFIIFSVVLISSIGIFSYTKSSDVINQQSLAYTDTVLNQVIDRIEKLKREIMNISIPFMINQAG